MERYINEMGRAAYNKYECKIYLLLSAMLPGEEFDIVKNVKKENYDLFIKIACRFMIDYGIHHPHSYNFNETYTKIDKQ